MQLRKALKMLISKVLHRIHAQGPEARELRLTGGLLDDDIDTALVKVSNFPNTFGKLALSPEGRAQLRSWSEVALRNQKRSTGLDAIRWSRIVYALRYHMAAGETISSPRPKGLPANG